MEITDRYRRSLKRKNYSPYTVKNYMNRIDHFILWLRVPLGKVTRREIGAYIDHLLKKRLSPNTIASHLQTLHVFFEYLIDEEKIPMTNPINRVSIRLPKPLPRHLKDDQADRLFAAVRDPRDKAIFMLMLRCGLRVEEVARLTVDAVDYRKRQVFVACGKGAKDRVVYLSDDWRPIFKNGRRRRKGCSSCRRGQ
jgi:site-specific recombinase XerD